MVLSAAMGTGIEVGQPWAQAIKRSYNGSYQGCDKRDHWFVSVRANQTEGRIYICLSYVLVSTA
jgi:hypothetical protein